MGRPLHAAAMCAAAVAWVAAGAGCGPFVVIAPRSGGFGRTAAPLPGEAVEIGVTGGVLFDAQTVGGFEGSGGTTWTSLNATSAEADLAYGLSERLALDLHLSPAGLQPGLRVSLLRGDLNLAVQPELAFGVGGGTLTSSSSPEWLVGVLLMGGFKLLASSPSGLYGGLGYHVQFTQLTLHRSSDVLLFNRQVGHNISFAIGYEVGQGPLRVRPEIAGMLSPVGSTFNESWQPSIPTHPAWFIYPNVTIVVRNP